MLVDSVTGAVTDVGPLGDNAFDIDLAVSSDGRLWGLNSEFETRVDLWEIDKATGAITSSFQVFDGTRAVTNAEGLGARGNQLEIAFAPVGGPSSSTLGDLSVTGVVSGTITSTSDSDGLANGQANPFGRVTRTTGNSGEYAQNSIPASTSHGADTRPTIAQPSGYSFTASPLASAPARKRQ